MLPRPLSFTDMRQSAELELIDQCAGGALSVPDREVPEKMKCNVGGIEVPVHASQVDHFSRIFL